MTPRQAAIKLIEHYVLRGDSIEDLRHGQMGCLGKDFSAEIGGFMGAKAYGPDKILVHRVKDKEVNKVFSLKKIFDFIKSGQQTLI